MARQNKLYRIRMDPSERRRAGYRMLGPVNAWRVGEWVKKNPARPPSGKYSLRLDVYRAKRKREIARWRRGNPQAAKRWDRWMRGEE